MCRYFKCHTNMSDPFISFQEKIEVPHLDKLYLYACQYDRSVYHPSLFDQYGIIYAESIHRAVNKRQAEYLAGRYCARVALKELGVKVLDIPTGQHRNPIWPKGVVGSITHTVDKAYAAVGYCTQFNCIGVDYEQIVTPKVANNIKAMIVNDKEHSLLIHSEFDFETALTIVFSAKESLFKALYPCVGQYFDFSAAEIITISKKEQRFELRLCQSLNKQLVMGSCFGGWFQVKAANVLTVIG
ncbi:MAG: 4'-phosphopantetheinyl transferase superfamily protein [Gammaproteobacteria bacterium]|nr:MAG: 4'-phosphopantetheinyl transferase superfamily protein [Gammaproteobacteria bacterium]